MVVLILSGKLCGSSYECFIVLGASFLELGLRTIIMSTASIRRLRWRGGRGKGRGRGGGSFKNNSGKQRPPDASKAGTLRSKASRSTQSKHPTKNKKENLETSTRDSTRGRNTSKAGGKRNQEGKRGTHYKVGAKEKLQTRGE